MQEIVLVASSSYCFNARDLKEVNAYLEQGWSVKEVKMSSSNDSTTAIFVLQKE